MVRASGIGPGAGFGALLLALLLAGCSGGSPTPSGGPIFAPSESSRFVIAEGDLPPVYEQVGSGREVDCDSDYLANQGGLDETASEAAMRRQLVALGPQGCRASTYERRIDDYNVTGFLVFVAVFPNAAAASKSLPLLRSSLADPLFRESFGRDGATLPAAQDIATAGLGDESTPGIRRTMPIGRVGGPDKVVTNDYIWRVGNVAVRMTGGFSVGELTEADVLNVAKNISARATTR